jgi:hypothetical protein
VSEFNKKGIVEYFERIEQAKKKKMEKELTTKVDYGKTW